MKDTERTSRINKDLDTNFPSNKGAWWVNNEGPSPDSITLHRGIGGERLDPRWIALRIFRREPSVHYIYSHAYISIVYTRDTLRRSGYKI